MSQLTCDSHGVGKARAQGHGGAPGGGGGWGDMYPSTLAELHLKRHPELHRYFIWRGYTIATVPAESLVIMQSGINC